MSVENQNQNQNQNQKDEIINMNFRVSKRLKREFITSAELNNRNASILLRDFMLEYIKQNNNNNQGSSGLND